MTRRSALAGSVGLAAGFATTAPFLLPRFDKVRKPLCSRVAILPVESYSEQLNGRLWDGLKQFDLDVRGKSVVLKPNLVDYLPGNHINTHPLLVASAAECFRRLGAISVVVAEGPGHQRDTQLLTSETGLDAYLKALKLEFIDFNRDELVKFRLRATYTGLTHLWLPRTALDPAAFLVSMPKVKAHHWAGVTLSMKNMFGIIPGAKYGWPKNLLHWRGIQQSVVDICATVPIHFVIADGIMAMEGNGPLNGTPRGLGRIILANDPVAADATCARLMGLHPNRISHIRETAKFLGNSSSAAIEQVGNPLRRPDVPFEVVPEFRHLRMAQPTTGAG
jgi:uncharacterized protein (DUF362 family)